MIAHFSMLLIADRVDITNANTAMMSYEKKML